jgi:hypothetical protein
VKAKGLELDYIFYLFPPQNSHFSDKILPFWQNLIALA